MREFFHMGGYAIYVWPAFALTFLVLALNQWSAGNHRRRAIRNLQRKIQLESHEPRS